MGDKTANVEVIFNAALVMTPATERVAYLDEACGDNADLRERVEALLRAHDEAGGFLAEPSPDEPGRAADLLVPGEEPSQRFGRYKLLQLIGEGGFGSVYMAEQEEPVRRKVALKIIKLGMDTKQVIARFEAERQALALMEHPNIARVLDAGATDTGRPYFVMELVKGVPITKYCDMNNLTTNERLDLFVPVCHAIQHAHQKGVIHRDIKPTNVMVTLHDGQPIPKVIDFGIAKATNQRLTEKTLFTEFRQFVGTPEYMSPEQAEMSGLDVDTRSDIYSLGVLLYELLSGATPFDPKTLRQAAYAEIQRVIREEEPLKPSTRFSSLGEASITIARNHRSDPASLQRELRGDLDRITMKCLQKDRTRRYAGAAELAADVRRHLAHEPVVAGPPGAAYRVQKFVRRKRGLVASAVVIFVVFAAAAVVSTSFGIRATRAGRLAETRLAQVEQAKSEVEAERDRALSAEQVAADQRAEAEAQRTEAQRQAKMATQAQAEAERQAALAKTVNDFLTRDLLASVDPKKALGREVTVREVLDKASEAINGKFNDDPLIEAAIRATLGETFFTLGDHEQAERHMSRALELRRTHLGDEHLDTLVSTSDLAILCRSRGRYEEAESLLQKALDVGRRALGEEHPQTLLAMSNLAMLYKTQSRFDEAEPLYVRALELRRKVLGEEHAATLNAMNGLAVLYRHLGRYVEAEQLYLQAFEARRRLFGEQHPDTLNSMNNLAMLYQRQGRHAEARPLLEKTLESGRAVFGEEHPMTLNCMANLAMLHRRQGHYDKAEPLAIRTVELRRKALGEEHPSTLMSMNNLAALYQRMGRQNEAEPLFVRTLALRKRVLGEEHSHTISSLNNLASLYRTRERFTEAEPLYVRALELSSRALGDEHPNTLMCMNNLAALYERQNRCEEAEQLHLKTLEQHRRLLGEEHPNTLLSRYNLACVYEKQQRHEDAERLHSQALEQRRRVLSDVHPETLESMHALAVLHENQTRYDKAKALYEEVVAGARATLPAGHWRTGVYLGNYGLLLVKLERYTEAEALLLESRDDLAATFGPTNRRTLGTIQTLIGLYEAWGKTDQAARWQATLPASRTASADPQTHPLGDE